MTIQKVSSGMIKALGTNAGTQQLRNHQLRAYGVYPDIQQIRGHQTPSGFGGATLLLHMDGANNSTTFTDVLGHAITPAGNAKISTAQSKFGGASAVFDGVGDYLETPYSTDFVFGTGDFTVEFWIYVNNDPTHNASTTIMDFSSYSGLGYLTNTAWFVNGTLSGANFTMFCNGVISSTQVGGSFSFAHSTWKHIAFVRSGSSFKTYLDGTLAASGTNAGSLNANTGMTLRIGSGRTARTDFSGYIDDVRINKGIAVYTSNFTPPAAAHDDP